MKAKIVKAWIHKEITGYLFSRVIVKDRGFFHAVHIVRCPHNWTITARPPRAKGSGKKGAKKK